MSWTEELPSGKHRGGYRDALGRKRHRTFHTRPAAEKWARQGEEDVRRGMSPDAGRLTVKEWSERWLAARVVESATSRGEQGRMVMIVEVFGDVPLERLSTLDIQSWEKKLLAGGMGTGTLRNYHGLLGAMLNAAVQERLISENPTRFVNLPPAPRGREVYLTHAEVDLIADRVTRDPYDVVTRVQPYLGFRWGEMAGLRVMDLDMLRQTAQVRQVVTQYGADRSIKSYPKNASSFRTVPIPDAQVEIIAAYLAGHRRSRTDPVFQTPDGQLLDRNRNSKSFKTALELAKVDKDARPHDLRHSGASWLAQAGVPIFAISKWLGHSSISTTMRYSHAAGDEHDEVREALNRLRRGTNVGQASAT